MICPGCEYKSDDGDRCPECGRDYFETLRLIEARDRFNKKLFRSHAIWFLIAAMVPASRAIFAGLGRDFPVLVVLQMVAGLVICLIVVKVEMKFMSGFLYRLDSSPRARDLWCTFVVASSILFAGYLWFRLR